MEQARINILGYYIKTNRKHQNAGVVYDKNGIAPSIATFQGRPSRSNNNCREL